MGPNGDGQGLDSSGWRVARSGSSHPGHGTAMCHECATPRGPLVLAHLWPGIGGERHQCVIVGQYLNPMPNGRVPASGFPALRFALRIALSGLGPGSQPSRPGRPGNGRRPVPPDGGKSLNVDSEGDQALDLGGASKRV